MIKRRYNSQTGELGAAYPEHLTVPTPYITLSNEENDRISTDEEHIYFYINNILVAKDRAEIEQKRQRIAEIKKELDNLDLKSIRAIRANDTEYIARYEAQAEELRRELAELQTEIGG